MESVQGQVLSGSGSGTRLVLRSRLGAITLALLCAVQFLDIADSAIVNVALPSIQHSLGFSQLAAEPAVGGQRLHPHLRRRSQHGARCLSRQRDGRRGRCLPRRSPVAGTRMAMGLLREPADLRRGGGRGAGPARRRPRRAGQGNGLRLAGGGARDRGHAAARVQPHPGSGGRLGIGPDHHHAGRSRRLDRGVRAQRAPEP